MNIHIIGGGIIGLSSAYYLQNEGHKVSVIDQFDFLNNCSFGNAGYVCPSHFVPLSNPGIIGQGLKWLLNKKSPFYIKPQLNWDLIKWAYLFYKNANYTQVNKAALPLLDISLLSQTEYASWATLPEFSFGYQHKGLLEVFQTENKQNYAMQLVEKSIKLGLTDTVLLNKEQLQKLEPQTKINALGALYFKCDAHVYPNKLMQNLRQILLDKGVRFIANEAVIKFEKKNKNITHIYTDKNSYKTDYCIIATGAYSTKMATALDCSLPLMPGRGYSITIENGDFKLNYPAILMDHRVALTPLDANNMRFGGTMEITQINEPPKLNRMRGILESVKKVYPTFTYNEPKLEDFWYGFRPCSADGLPYIGKTKQWDNIVFATGHSMLGLSLGAGTGKLVKEIVQGQKTSINIEAFNVDRFF